MHWAGFTRPQGESGAVEHDALHAARLGYLRFDQGACAHSVLRVRGSAIENLKRTAVRRLGPAEQLIVRPVSRMHQPMCCCTDYLVLLAAARAAEKSDGK